MVLGKLKAVVSLLSVGCWPAFLQLILSGLLAKMDGKDHTNEEPAENDEHVLLRILKDLQELGCSGK